MAKIQPLRESGGRRVANRQALAVRRNEIGVRDAHARGRAVPGENDITAEVDFCQVGQFAIRRRQDAGVGDFQLLYDIRRPVVGKAFPGQHVDRAGAEQRPQRHFDRPRIRRRRDRDAIIGGHAQNLARQFDGAREFVLADLGPMGAAKRRAGEVFERPSRPLGARTGGKTGI